MIRFLFISAIFIYIIHLFKKWIYHLLSKNLSRPPTEKTTDLNLCPVCHGYHLEGHENCPLTKK